MEALQMTVTPAIAADWLVRYSLDVQRKPSKSRILGYAADMAAGRWIAMSGGPIEIVKNGTAAWLVNGQHRLYAIVESGTSQDMSVLYHHGTIETARKMYSAYDQQFKRTFAELYSGGISSANNRHEFGAALIVLSNVMNYRTATAWSRKPTMQQVLDMGCEWEPHYMRWREVRGEHDFVKRFDSAPFIAAAMYTLRHAPDVAVPFWAAVTSGETNQDSGERKLREFALSYSMPVGKGHGGGQQEFRMRACSICWNAAHSGAPLKKLIVDRAKYKISFAGTPLE